MPARPVPPNGTAGPSALRPRSRFHDARTPATLAILLVSAALYALYSMVRYAQFRTAGYDLGIFDQAVRHYAHLRPPYSPMKGYRYDLLGDHFHPLLALFAPLYWVWDDPRVLLLGQALLVASCAPVLIRICDRRMSPVLSRILVCLFMISWPLQGLIDFDFHETCLAMPLLCLAFDALDRRRPGPFAAWSLLLVGVREDMGLVVAMLGLVWIVDPRNGVLPNGVPPDEGPRRSRWRTGLPLSAAGLLSAALVLLVIVPRLAGSGHYGYWDYPGLGSGPRQMIGSVAAHPLAALQLLVDSPVKRQTLAWLGAPLLLLFLCSPRWIVAIPLVLGRFWAARELLWYPRFHYNAPIFLILFVSAVSALGSRPLSRWRRPLSLALIVSLAASIPLIHRENRLAEPLLDLPRQIRTGEPAERTRAMEQALRLVPADTCVSADDRLVPRLTRTNRVSVPGTPGPKPSFILLDMTRPDTGGGLDSPVSARRKALAAGYRTVFDSDGIVVLRAPVVRTDAQSCGPTAP